MDEYEHSASSRHFSNLNLPQSFKDYSIPRKSCPTTAGLENVHTELLALLIADSIFRDFFNVFLLLPIHSHQCVIKKSNEDTFFKVFPLERGSGMKLSNDRMLQWLYSNRLPFFLSSRLYELCIFTHKFCKDNPYLVYDRNIEYTRKQLNMLSDLHTVEGIQKVIRHAGDSSDGAIIQLWLDLQWLRHTDKDQGYNDMIKTILTKYEAEANKLPDHFKQKLVKAVATAGKISLNTFHLKRKETLWQNFDNLIHAPFLEDYYNASEDKNHIQGNQISQENVNNHDYISNSNLFNDLQDEIMKSLKIDFCQRYLSYYDCLLPKFCNTSPDMSIYSIRTRSAADQQGPLNTGRAKSTLPTVSVDKVASHINKNRPKTCYPHLHPKVRAISRLSEKTSGYISLTAEDRIAVCSSKASTLSPYQLHRSYSEPNLHIYEPLSNNKDKLHDRCSSMINLYNSRSITVNVTALEKCRKSVLENKDELYVQTSCQSMSIDLESNNDQQTKSLNVSPTQELSVQKTKSNHIKLSSGGVTISPVHLSSQGHNDVNNELRTSNFYANEVGDRQPTSDGNRLENTILQNESSYSVTLKGKALFDNVMRIRRASSFMRKSPGLKALYGEQTDEQKKIYDDIIKHKTPEVMYNQDKIRLYVTIVASDHLAGGPFRNYLITNHKDVMLDCLNLWENIEILRCFKTEGGRRGATAKSFGGNGFLSTHDEYITIKDDPYHQYHNSLRDIKRYPDSLYEFNKKLDFLKDFLTKNQIKKPYNIDLLNKYVEQLETAGCNDEVLALGQDHMITKMKNEIDAYYAFDSKNFYYYVSHKDKSFNHPDNNGSEDKAQRYLLKSRKTYKNSQYHTSIDLFRECIYSPMSSRMWMAIDMCERLIFPFASRKLSMPMLTLGSMIHMKVFLLRRRRKKQKLLQLSDIPKKEDEISTVKKVKLTKKKLTTPKLKKREKPSFYINWDAIILEHRQKVYEIIKKLHQSITKNINILAPPTIDDLLTQHPTLKSFRKFIYGKYRGNEKDQYIAIVNFIVALKQVDEKINWCEISDLCKTVCSSYIFGKNSILNTLDLPDHLSELISRKRAYEPTFVLFVGALVKKWIHDNLWSNYISSTYAKKNIDYEQYQVAKEFKSWNKPSIFNKTLCKRLMHFITRLRNFLNFLSNPAQYEQFREFLLNQRQSIDSSGQLVDKIVFNQSNSPEKLFIFLSRLPQDLILLYEINCYKNLVLTSISNARYLSYDGTEDPMVRQKIDLIVETFLDSAIPPKLQVNLSVPITQDIIISAKKQHIPYNLFNEVAACILQSLLIFWKKFCVSTYAPESKKKAKIIKKLSGTPVSTPVAILPKLKQTVNKTSVTTVYSSKKSSRSIEVGGIQYSVTSGIKNLYRAKNQSTSIPNETSNNSMSTLASSVSKLNFISSVMSQRRNTAKDTDLKRDRWKDLSKICALSKTGNRITTSLPPVTKLKIANATALEFIK